MKCNFCNHINKDTALFCVECGSPFYKKCPNCDTNSLLSYKFCPNCGNAFDVKLDALNQYKRKLVFFESVVSYEKVWNLVIVRNNKLYGIFNILTQRLVVPCEYDTFRLFTKDYVFLHKNDCWHMYNPLTGTRMCYDTFEEVEKVTGWEFAKVKRNGLWGILSLNSGNYAVFPQYTKFDYAGFGREVLACKDGLWGCIGYSEVSSPVCRIPFEYLCLNTAEFEDKPHPSQHKNHKWGVIRSNGDKILDFEYDEIEYYEPFGVSVYYLRKDNFWGVFRSGILHPCVYTREQIKNL